MGRWKQINYSVKFGVLSPDNFLSDQTGLLSSPKNETRRFGSIDKFVYLWYYLYMTFSREQLEFGSSSFVGPALNDPSFYDLSIRDQARAIGWAVGCPVVDELTDPANPEPGRGPEEMLNRYAQVGFWFGYIVHSAEEHNPDLYSQLVQQLPRLAGEPVGIHEPQSVPDNYDTVIPPSESLAGFTLPRLLLKQIGGDSLPKEEKQSRLLTGLRILQDAVISAQTPEELLAISAEGISLANVDPLITLSTVLPQGWYDEHNGDQMVASFKASLSEKAPQLWGLYCTLTDKDKSDRGIL